MNQMVILYIINESKTEAKKIAKHLLEKRLIACANIFPISSMYWWEKKITSDNESVLLVKTTKTNFERAKKEIIKIHPYDTPCIIKLNAQANPAYFNWLKKEVR